MKKQIIIGLAAVAVLVALLYPQPIWVRIGLAKWKWHEKDIEFYGKVVDPDNTPVEGALVTVNVPKQVGLMADLKSRGIHTEHGDCAAAFYL